SLLAAIRARPTAHALSLHDALPIFTEMGKRHSFDAAVVANGAWLGDWRRRLGIRTAIQGGRGYSFLVPTPMPITRAIYFPTERIVCTPVMGKLRISAVMDVEHPGARFKDRKSTRLNSSHV